MQTLPEDNGRYTLYDHAHAIAELLASKWEVDGLQRSWHATYVPFLSTEAIHFVVVQTRGVGGFQVACIQAGSLQEARSGPALSLLAACVWLGLAAIHVPLAWQHEL
jgi:hypothetical protein